MSIIDFQMGISGRLDAINIGLRALGSSGISSLDEVDQNVDAAAVDSLINQHSQFMQSNSGKGWWFNREEFHKLTPDPVNGYVSVPNSTLSVMVKRNNGKVVPVTMRGTKLFDAKTMGYDMRSAVFSDGYLHCVLIVNLDFDTLPPIAKQAVTDMVCFYIINDLEGDQTKMQAYQQASQRSLLALQAEDVSQVRHNMFDNPYLKSTMNLAGGYNNVR